MSMMNHQCPWPLVYLKLFLGLHRCIGFDASSYLSTLDCPFMHSAMPYAFFLLCFDCNLGPNRLTYINSAISIFSLSIFI